MMVLVSLKEENQIACSFSFAVRKGHVRTHREGSHLQAMKRTLNQNQIDQNLDLRLPNLQNLKK